MNVSVNLPGNENTLLPEGANIFSRKVARSGHLDDRLIVDTSIPLHKEYPLV